MNDNHRKTEKKSACGGLLPNTKAYLTILCVFLLEKIAAKIFSGVKSPRSGSKKTLPPSGMLAPPLPVGAARELGKPALHRLVPGDAPELGGLTDEGF